MGVCGASRHLKRQSCVTLGVDDPLKWIDLKREGLTKEVIKFRTLGDALIQHGVDTLGKLARHETTLMQGFIKTVQMLHFYKMHGAATEVKRLQCCGPSKSVHW